MSSSRPRSDIVSQLRAPHERRRSQRVMLRVPVSLHLAGRDALRASTVVVNDNGAMLLLEEPLPADTQFAIENQHTGRRMNARVTRAAQLTQEGALVPVEFESAAADFWSITFPPVSNNNS